MQNILTLNGSAFSQGIDFPHDTGRNRSGSDSGTHTKINKRSNNEIAVARATTTESLYVVPRYAPNAGLVMRLAANVADTCTQHQNKFHYNLF